MTWADRGRRCVACDCVTYRPPRSEEPCPCGGELRDETPEEAAERVRRNREGRAT